MLTEILSFLTTCLSACIEAATHGTFDFKIITVSISCNCNGYNENKTKTIKKIRSKIPEISNSGVNESARERIGRQNLSQKVPSKKGSLGVIFSPRNYRENAHSKSANFEGRHSGGHLLGRPLLFTSDQLSCPCNTGYLLICKTYFHACNDIGKQCSSCGTSRRNILHFVGFKESHGNHPHAPILHKHAPQNCYKMTVVWHNRPLKR